MTPTKTWSTVIERGNGLGWRFSSKVSKNQCEFLLTYKKRKSSSEGFGFEKNGESEENSLKNQNDKGFLALKSLLNEWNKASIYRL